MNTDKQLRVFQCTVPLEAALTVPSPQPFYKSNPTDSRPHSLTILVIFADVELWYSDIYSASPKSILVLNSKGPTAMKEPPLAS